MSPALAAVVLVVLLSGVRTQDTGGEDTQTWSNPCLHYKCPGDSQCVSIANGLLQLPIPHCVQKQQPHSEFEDDGDDDKGCWGRDVGVSIVSCKTHHQWQAIASATCGTSASIVSIEVRHPCHRRDSTSPAIFLQATISCCPEPVSTETPPITAVTTPTFPTYYDAVPPSNDTEQQEEDEEDEEEKDDIGVGVVVIVTLGCLMVSSVIVLGIIKLFCDMRRKRAIVHKHRLSFVTSYVNKNSEGCEGCEGVRMGGGKPDFSYVVANDNHVY